MSEQQHQLVMRKGPKPGQVYPLFGEILTIGREPTSDIALNDPEVSRQHARLLRTESGFVLEDLGSTNGTYIDGVQLINDAAELEPGQVIDLGSGVTLVYEAVGAADEDWALDAWGDSASNVAYRGPDTFDYDEPSSPPRRETAYASPSSQPPLVPSGESEQQKRRRRNIIIAVTAVVLLCCCCLAFFLSAWYWWGDPLMEMLGLY